MTARNVAQDTELLPLRTLSSGRTVLLRTSDGGEQLEIRSPDGDVEVSIALTSAGPVVTLRGARLELESTGRVGVSCETFDVHARGGIALRSEKTLRIDAGELRAKTEEDIHLNGAFIRLNCTPESAPAAAAEETAAAATPCACGHPHAP